MRKHIHTLEKLLQDNPIAYYWIGFILADGHIHNSARLKVALSKKDRDHLEKLASFLNAKNIRENKNNVELSIMNSSVVRLLCSKFDIQSTKTYNPPKDLSFIKDPNLLDALKIGFIDGDGSIGNPTGRKDFRIRIQCHSSWLSILEYLFGKSNINGSGFASVQITDSVRIKDLKRTAIALGLPIMNRKWDVIDLSFVGKQEKCKDRIVRVRQMLLEKVSTREMSNRLGIGQAAVCNLIRRYKLRDE